MGKGGRVKCGKGDGLSVVGKRGALGEGIRVVGKGGRIKCGKGGRFKSGGKRGKG